LTKNPPKVEELSDRWYPLSYHPTQAKLWESSSRFNVVPAGRRSGKTEISGKRKVIIKALQGDPKYPDYNIFVAAPTFNQAKRIYWTDLKKLSPKHLIKRVRESGLTLEYVNGSSIQVMGMDKPERIEGSPWNHGVLDEYGNMKEQTWPEHVRPALADRNGTCDFIGVPEGRNHYYDLWKRTLADDSNLWAGHHWISADILPPEEIEQAKRDLDDLTYQQEFEGSFVLFAGMAYYNWNEKRNCQPWGKHYDPKGDLIFMLDFNVEPGVAAVAQEMKRYVPNQIPIPGKSTTAVIGEVYIPRNSNTIRVCDKLVEDWSDHKGNVFCYGDSTGGAGGSAKVSGSDWDLVKKVLFPVFGERLHFRIPPANPRERVRVNSVNSRLLNVFSETYLVVDPGKAPHVVKDFEGVRLIEGGVGDIDKKSDPKLTHLSDAIGYYIHREYPVRRYEISTHKRFLQAA
jgi:hypothetical protein